MIYFSVAKTEQLKTEARDQDKTSGLGKTETQILKAETLKFESREPSGLLRVLESP